MARIFFDFETRSAVDLLVHGLARYSSHPSTDVNCYAVAVGDGDVKVWTRVDGRPPEEPPRDAEIVAHNAEFELAIWNNVMVRRYGWAPLDPSRVTCTMARCYAMSLPGALENAAPALGLAVQKDNEGRLLMLKMCKPRADGSYLEDVASMKRLGEYCAQDVIVERQIFKRTFELSPAERQLWELNCVINLRGIPFDMPTVKGMVKLAGEEKLRLDAQMGKVTGDEVTAASNVGSLKEWAADYGVMSDSLAKEFLKELLKADLPEPVTAALLIRQEAARLTSLAKLNRLLDQELLGRIRYAFAYHAATTGRFAGRGVQPHNFTRDLPDPQTVETVLKAVRDNDPGVIELFGPVITMMSRCMRALIYSNRGLLAGDYSAIEGCGSAWLAGEEWKLAAYRECFADPRLPDMYVRTAAKILHVKTPDVTRDQRQAYGKVPELAFGYQGGIGAFHTMAKTYGVHLTDAEADRAKTEWRAEHPAFKDMWYDYQHFAIAACTADKPFETHRVAFRRRGSFLFAKLPSGRVLTYPYPEVRGDDYGPYLTYKTVPDPLTWAIYQNAKKEGKPNTTQLVEEEGENRKWARTRTYGGKLTENITQAVCRDILTEAMLRVEQGGMPVVMHVHDEIVSEGQPHSLEDFRNALLRMPVWAQGFPITAKCWAADRYQKVD